MAESFIEEIYQKSMILERLKECSFYLSVENVTKVKKLWKESSDSIQSWCKELTAEDIDSAKALLTAWQKALKSNGNFKILNSELSRCLIPCVTALMEMYTGIDVKVGKWRILSADTGFLILENSENNRLLYNSYDPMWETFNLANNLFDPTISNYHLLGVGLGYLAYQLWELSYHSIEIYIYEDELDILNFSQQYGVLDWIDSNHIHIITADSGEDVFLEDFFSNTGKTKNLCYISEWKTDCYKGKYDSLVKSFDFTARTFAVSHNQWAINRRKNLELNPKPISELDTDIFSKEVMVVSAGPSLNNCIDFIKKNQGKKTIIAINAVLKRLHKENIKPDIIVMIDPLDNMREHIRGVEEISTGVPLVSSVIANFDFMEVYQGPIYIIPTIKTLEFPLLDCEKGEPWDNVEGTVASLGIELAYYIGAEKIYLIGSDLAYTNGNNYASGVAHGEKENIEESVFVPAAGGGEVATNNLYNMYREMLEKQIQAHENIKVYNLAIGGAKIKGTEEFYL